jgi:hypothetical protein
VLAAAANDDPQQRLAECHARVDCNTISIHAAVIVIMALLVGLRRELQWSNVLHVAVITLDAAAIFWLRRGDCGRFERLRDWVTGATQVLCNLVGVLGLTVWFTTQALYNLHQQQQQAQQQAQQLGGGSVLAAERTPAVCVCVPAGGGADVAGARVRRPW